jgi:dTDP-4-dehydrorhamnose reductase
MTMQTSNHLVVGINGTIGAALYQQLKKQSHHTISAWGTTKRMTDVSPPQVFYLNLNGPPHTWQFPHISFDVVYLCAGVCRMAHCEDDPVATSKINIDGMCELAKRLSSSGAFVIYLSTNQVFSGENPYVEDDAPYQPLNEYGRQKAIVEGFVKEKCERNAIVRLTKVIVPEMPLVQQWIDSLKQNKSILAFHNMMLAPVSLRTVTDFLQLLGEKKQPGCYALSGDQDVSYFDVANYIAREMHVSSGLIQSINALDQGIKKNFLPRFTTMRSSSTIALCGLRPPTIEDVLHECFNF